MPHYRPLLATLLATLAGAAAFAPTGADAAAPVLTAHTALTSRSCASRRTFHARRACAASLRRHAASHQTKPYSRPGVSSGGQSAAPHAPVGTPAATPGSRATAGAPGSPGSPGSTGSPGSSGSTGSTANATPAVAATPPPVASTAPCDNTDLLPSPSNVAVVEAATLCLINQVRGEHGLSALVVNPDLQQTAEQHDNDMVAQNYFAHNGPAGDTPETRIEATGYVNPSLGYILGENIAWGTLDMSSPAAIVNAWVNSPDHLANILQPVYTDTGMAVAPQVPTAFGQGQPGAIYTEDFGGVQAGQ